MFLVSEVPLYQKGFETALDHSPMTFDLTFPDWT